MKLVCYPRPSLRTLQQLESMVEAVPLAYMCAQDFRSNNPQYMQASLNSRSRTRCGASFNTGHLSLETEETCQKVHAPMFSLKASNAFKLEDDGSQSVGAAVYGNAFLLIPRKTAAESQGPNVTVNCVPSGSAETLGHPPCLNDELLTIPEQSTRSKAFYRRHRAFLKNLRWTKSLQNGYPDFVYLNHLKPDQSVCSLVLCLGSFSFITCGKSSSKVCVFCLTTFVIGR